MKENNEINYNEYDAILNKIVQELFIETKGKDKIAIKYDKNSSENNLILEICFFWQTLLKKSVYVKANIITFLKLRIREKRKVKFLFNKNYPLIIPSITIKKVCNDSIKVGEIYDAYYSKKRTVGIK